MTGKCRFVLILGFILLIIGGVYSHPQGQDKRKERQMLQFKKGDTYDKDWKRVEKFIEQGLPRSALEVVDQIYRKARKADNAAQMVKALIKRMLLKAAYEEEAPLKAIQEMETEVAHSRFPVTPILQSMLAEMYWSYYQAHRYQILDRSRTVGIDLTDIRTWDARQFTEKAISLYWASLANADSLQRTPLEVFDPVLEKAEGSRRFRPTLYDLLAHRALDFFMNSETDLTRPAEQFFIRDEAAFTPPETFVETTFETRDTLSFQHQALRLFQEVIRFHLQDESPEALVDVDLKRLKFVWEKSVHDLKDSLYIRALETLEQRYRDYPISTWISYERASFYNRLAMRYRPGVEPTYRWHRRTAYAICQEAIRRFPQSEGAQNCRALMAEITHKSVQIETEAVNLPEQPFRALVRYANVSRLYLRAVPTTPEERRRLQEKYRRKWDREDWVAHYRGKKAAAEWSVALPDPGDFQEHAVEIGVPELPPGQYVLLAGTDPDFTTDTEAAGYAATWVSRLSLIYSLLPEGGAEFFVLDREAGTPVPGVRARLWVREYDPGIRQQVEKMRHEFTTDAEGRFVVPPPPGRPRSHIFRVDLQKGKDRLFMEETYSLYPGYRRKEKPRSQHRTFFFTDRAIYRPGQTVYFKGIIIESEGENRRIVPGHNTTVQLLDANHQKVGELSLTTNEYGTFSGSFILPTGGLTGVFTLKNESGRVSISVEAYKRPRFEVTFDPVKGSFQLNDTVTVTGQARSYAGANIDNAAVRFRVVRKTFFPYVWDIWRWPWLRVEEVEILNGEITTDAEGRFTIRFPALPDLSVPPKHQPVFTYTVQAEVTDVAGETREALTRVTVGYVALQADVELPANISRDRPLECPLITKNFNGEFEPAQGTVTIYALKAPERIFRPRLWAKPDTFVMSREEFYRLFPHDPHDGEDDFHNWERGKKMREIRFDTGKSTTLRLEKLDRWPEGKYVAEMTTQDAFGNPIRVVRFFTLYSEQENAVPAHALFWRTVVKGKAEPGDTALILWGSAATPVRARLEIFHGDQVIERRWITADRGKYPLAVPIREAYRGNVALSLFFVRYGRVYHFTHLIQVPWSNKQLRITYETFRDKLKPGQPEEWRLKISGPEGERVAAEMVAAMYDASLDAFRPHGWEFAVFPRHGFPRYWQGYRRSPAFGTTRFQLWGEHWNVPGTFIYRQYDRLNWSAPGGIGPFYAPLEKRAAGGGVTESAGMPVEGRDVDTMPLPEKVAPAPAPGELPPADGGHEMPPPPEEAPAPPIPVRRNLNETAFFYPHLRTNEQGEILIAFTMPEALTRWKFLGFAHTADLEFALTEKEVITRKELMVMPHAPRFFREGDRMSFTAGVVNLTDRKLSGTAELHLFDALTMQPVDASFGNDHPTVSFSVEAGQSAPLRWEITVPEGAPAVTYRVTARTERFSDGEESTLPVLTNRTLVTETLPLPIRGKQRKTFRLNQLAQSSRSSTLRHHRLTLEFTSNPAWYAIQALPYMMEFPYECSEQIFSRYYANSIAAHILNGHPKIRRVFEQWKSRGALISNLEKNPALKSLLLEETPWVLQAQDEAERKKRVGLLFDLNRLAQEERNALRKLQQMQLSNGGWPWFPGDRENRFITQHIVAGFGHLDQLGIKAVRENPSVWQMIRRAVHYLDERMAEDYRHVKEGKGKLKEQHIGSITVHYLYCRSYFPDIPLEKKHREAFEYWKSQAAQYWLKFNKYLQGMIGLALHRMGDKKTPAAILRSLREHALHSEEMGMYWKSPGGYFWYQAPIERQALLIELFDEVAQDQAAVDAMRVWLLKQKQTRAWKSTKATTEACYALLRRGTDWLAGDQQVEVTVGGRRIDPRKMAEGGIEAGTGYFRISWPGEKIRPEMATVVVEKSDEGVAWGALYWQYFEDLDKITAHQTPLKLSRQLFVERSSPTGPVIEPITEATPLKPGDLIKVRIELRVDRPMEFVHLKDMRAAGLEPVHVLSHYRYQGGLGYYESTRDAATHFFISYLPKGTFVLEYPLRVTHQGDFSAGYATIQSMYAPEFSAHSEGLRLRVSPLPR